MRNHKVFLLIFFVFFIIKVYSLFVAHDIWWDSSVYVGMGKYIYSSGEAGLWEPSRPLVWPLILGFFWKIGLNPVFFGKLLVIVFSSGILLLTYLIALHIFNRKVAILSSLFLALSSTFFLFGNILHPEIPSTFFALLGFYYFIKKKYGFSGLFLGIAFMTRFFQIFIAIPLLLILLYLIAKNKESFRRLLNFSIFFLIPIIPYLILNYFLYNNIFHPFLLQFWMSNNTGWVFFQPFWFYFINLVKENILILFSVLGLLFIFRKYDSKLIMAIVFLFIFVPYNLVAHKEMRLLIPALPFLYILTGYGLLYFVNLFKRNKKLILSLLLFIFLILNIPDLRFDRYDDNLDVFYNYIEAKEIGNGLWLTNPAFIAFSDDKADELIYFPLYNSEKIDELSSDIADAEHILINTCDILPCPPSDSSCSEKHDDFIDLLKERFTLESFSEKGQCKYYIFN